MLKFSLTTERQAQQDAVNAFSLRSQCFTPRSVNILVGLLQDVVHTDTPLLKPKSPVLAASGLH